MNKKVIYSLSFIVAALVAVWFVAPKNAGAEDELYFDASCYCYYKRPSPTPSTSPEPTPKFGVDFPDELPTPEVTPTPIVTPSPELPIITTPTASPTVEPAPTPEPVVIETKGEATATATPTASPTPITDGRGGVISPTPSATPVAVPAKDEEAKPTPSPAPTAITLIEPVLTRLPQAGINLVTVAQSISGMLALGYMAVRKQIKAS